MVDARRQSGHAVQICAGINYRSAPGSHARPPHTHTHTRAKRAPRTYTLTHTHNARIYFTSCVRVSASCIQCVYVCVYAVNFRMPGTYPVQSFSSSHNRRRHRRRPRSRRIEREGGDLEMCGVRRGSGGGSLGDVQCVDDVHFRRACWCRCLRVVLCVCVCVHWRGNHSQRILACAPGVRETRNSVRAQVRGSMVLCACVCSVHVRSNFPCAVGAQVCLFSARVRWRTCAQED